jgi:hypothetical protein
MSAISEEWDRKVAEQNERYAQIERLWEASDIPTFVKDTPDWQGGVRVLYDWLAAHDWPVSLDGPLVHDNGWPVAGSPYWSGRWDKEVHIFSHMLHRGGGHSMHHADIEEEGTRVILQWWAGQQNAGRSVKEV